MDYLRTLGSAAVSSLVQKSGFNLPFSIGLKIINLHDICNLYDGIKREDGSFVSIFEYDFSDPAKKTVKQLAANALRKLRTTRHPDVLKFMDAVETDTHIYIMTERVKPLQLVLQSWSSRDVKEREDWLIWGLHRISVALSFINDSCSSTHGNICVSSIFISPSGEWKLGGFELFSNAKEESPTLYVLSGFCLESSHLVTPEVRKGGWSVLKEYEPTVADAYALGILLHAVFNPSHPRLATTQPPHPPPNASSSGAIPPSVFPSFKKLLNPSPKGRLTPKAFLELGMTDTGFFATNKLVKVCLGLDNFALGSEAEKNFFLRTLKESSTSFPPEFTSHRVLPSLVTALEYGGASAPTILPLVLQFGSNVPPEDYSTVIIAPLIKLYANPDRGTRIALLEHLPEYVDKLDKKTVSEKIFPHLSTGFSDTVPVIREATIKSIILLAPKLTDRILNNDLLRFLAKTQSDTEPSIRTNTCILIGRLGPTLGYHTRKKVLVPAFVRALKDPFVHARVAGLMALMATIDCFEIEDIANRVIPNISFAMIDKEKLVRDQAFKAVELFVKRLENHAMSMPETATPIDTSTTTNPQDAAIVTTAAGAASSLAGWAISSLGKKLISSDLQTTIGIGVGGTPTERATSAPTPARTTNSFPDQPLSSLTPPTMSATASPVAPHSPLSTSRARGMQLGANKIPANVAASILSEEYAEDFASTSKVENPWGNDDLIDVNADQDDWSAFESAPPAIIAPKPVRGSQIPATLKINPEPINRNAASRSPSLPLKNGSAQSPSPKFNASEMSKEERAAEMARRKEERKQRIALLKEQKKNVAQA